MKKSVKTKNEAETLNVGKELGASFKGGEVVALYGDLGAGKTIFTKGLAQGLGYKKVITSPTFVLMKVYGPDNPQIENFAHVDCYRVDSSEDLYGIGFNDYLGRKDTVMAIEWAEKVQDVLQKSKSKIVKVKIKLGRKELERLIEIS
ncbi:tRNA (adenosine(37)-N6)-threonylcarbamoyltransferase complex ATPase subunit type 1 TsaE [Patescibacteria group bacterium]|nr:tRNA (adenosine(37)-N6)-threonylcarbamoyltransferase complex ATPase subunit type 1 TsaE [Patescibacteria group bacterium]